MINFFPWWIRVPCGFSSTDTKAELWHNMKIMKKKLNLQHFTISFTLTLFHGNILMIVLALDYTLFSSSSLFLCNSQLCDVTQMNSFHTTHSFFFFLCFVMYSRCFVRIIIKCIKLHQTMEWRRVKHQRRSSFWVKQKKTLHFKAINSKWIIFFSCWVVHVRTLDNGDCLVKKYCIRFLKNIVMHIE